MAPRLRNRPSGTDGGAAAALTPAQKGAATRKANREKKEAEAAAAHLRVNAGAATHGSNDDDEAGRSAQPRRAAASTTSAASQGEEVEGGSRKRAASSAEPQPTIGSVKKAPKKRKSDAAISVNTTPMEDEEEPHENTSTHGGIIAAGAPALETVEFVRPRPTQAQQQANGTNTRSGIKEKENQNNGEGDDDDDENGERPLDEDGPASDEAERDEQWDGAEDALDDDNPASSKKTSKALARQFEQATPIWKPKSKASSTQHAGSPTTQGRDESTRGVANLLDVEAPSRGQRTRTSSHEREDRNDIAGVQGDIERMNIDRDNGGRRRGQHRPTNSRRLRVESEDDLEPLMAEHAAPREQLAKRPRGQNGERDNSARRVSQTHGDAPGEERERESRSSGRAHWGEHHSLDEHGHRDRHQVLDRPDDQERRRRGYPDRDHGQREHIDTDLPRDYRDHRSKRDTPHPTEPQPGWDSDDHNRPRPVHSSVKQHAGSARNRHKGRQTWREPEDVYEIEDTDDERARQRPTTKRAGKARRRHSVSDEDSEDIRPRSRPHERVRVKQEPGQDGRKGRVRRRTRATFVIDSNDELVEGAAEDGESDNSQIDDGLPRDGQWPGRTKFNLGDHGRPTLGDQYDGVANVISYTCATEVPKFVCFQDAFPLADDRIPLFRAALMKGARALKSRVILARLESETSYVEKMAIIPEGRMSIFRGKVRDKAAAGVKMHYKFATFPAREFTVIIGKLLEDRRHIFPGDAVRKTIEEENPYCHPAILYIIHESFFGGNPVKKFPVEYYPVSPRTKKRQLPKSMVAFAATANEAALMAYRMGPTPVKIPFYGDTFDDVYSVHLATLDQIYKDDAEVFDGLMTYLYEQTSGEATAASGSSSRRGEQVRPISIVTANITRFK
ncbi:hypothetical protein BV25DRAFT_1918433 [Artomyces pyxidatus]|uniref:Uncharacterized protein n=1 Tax=Artomyces pyxidatus TaxID=48021 RepID=A0ACB8SSA6_9AGAM|nr:hypothetical protein BV25DRAFT_1918433 [Artomyces pyxidatus]